MGWSRRCGQVKRLAESSFDKLGDNSVKTTMIHTYAPIHSLCE